MQSYKDLTVWKKSIQLCVQVYKITESFPKHELYGITSQIRRSSTAIPSNIAEGQKRGHKTEFIQFLRIAYGSGAELETQLYIALQIKYLKLPEFEKINDLLEEIMKMLNVLLRNLSNSTNYKL
jgi:four helix bundle protein